MSATNIYPLIQQWQEAKAAETEWKRHRQELEDQLAAALELAPDLDRTQNVSLPEGKLKIVGRINRSVDVAKAQQITQEMGAVEHLQRLFRWKAEVNMSAWKAADSAITGPLAEAITEKPGRPSFSFEEADNG